MITKIINKIIKWITSLVFIKCPKCKTNALRHSHEEYLNRTWINVYECKNCNEKFV